MAITAEIIADSINPQGCRLTTWVLEYHRYVHSELGTHRVFSRNAASSRAIPIEKMIEAVMTNPAMPVWWGKNQSGMQAKEELDDVYQTIVKPNYADGHYQSAPLVTAREAARERWLMARDRAVCSVQDLMALGLHKQIANRILEPWFYIRIILSGTEYENFFALRAHPDAQPEIQALAYLMLERYNASTPKVLAPGEWHVPFGDQIDETRLAHLVDDTKGQCHERSDIDYIEDQIRLFKRKVAIARCARISYLNYEGKDDYAADIKLCDRLFGSNPKHLSPTEHVAQCLDSDEFVGNFRGWRQFRKGFADEVLTDGRVRK